MVRRLGLDQVRRKSPQQRRVCPSGTVSPSFHPRLGRKPSGVTFDQLNERVMFQEIPTTSKRECDIKVLPHVSLRDHYTGFQLNLERADAILVIREEIRTLPIIGQNTRHMVLKCVPEVDPGDWTGIEAR